MLFNRITSFINDKVIMISRQP